MTTVVVGTGYTGLRLLKQLPADAALGLSRSVPPATAGRTVRELGLDDPPATIAVPSPCRLLYTVPPANDAPGDRRLKAFLAALSSVPERIVYVSTTGVYGDHQGGIVTETTPVAPGNERSARRVAAETLLAEWAEQHGSEVTILRVPGIYGPDRLMIEGIRNRSPLIDEAEASPGNRIHVDDLVAACLAALDPGVPAGIYNVGDGDEQSSTWFALEVARQLGLEAPPIVSRKEAEATFSPMRLSFVRESRRVDTRKMREVLGVTPRYADAADGIRASLEEMGLL